MKFIVVFLNFILQLTSIPTGSQLEDNILKIQYSDSIVEYDLNTYRVIDNYKIQYPIEYNPKSYHWIDDYYVHTGGGMVYVNVNDTLYRVDKSFDHKLQLSSLIFKRKDSIFRYGGYGFFSARNFLTYFDKKIKEWEVLPINGKVYPLGIFNGIKINKDNKFIFLGGYKINPNDRSKTLLNYQVFEFDFVKRSWKELGISSKNYLNNRRYIETEFGLIFLGENIEVIDLSQNKIVVLENNPLFRKISSSLINPFIYKDTVFFLNDYNVESLDKIGIDDLLETKRISQSSFFDHKISDHEMVEIFSKLILVFLVVLLMFLILTKDKIIVLRTSFRYRFRILKLSNFEDYLLRQLIQKKENKISNQDVLKIFDQSDLDIGTITRRKNDLINGLNHKLKFLLNIDTEPIQVNKSLSDRRNTYYSLNRSVFLIFTLKNSNSLD